MPVCQRCQRFAPVGQPCPACGHDVIEATQFDPDVGGLELGGPIATPTDGETTKSLRPVGRAPVMRLIAVDDDDDESGEVFRLRHRETTLGRCDGDIRIPQDQDISARHAAIVRRPDAADSDRWTWHLVDLQSTNGTFIRRREFELDVDRTFRIANATYRFRPPVVEPLHRGDRVVELQGDGPWTFGRDRQRCDVVMDDEVVNPIHAAVRCRNDQWILQDLDSRNGIWQSIVDVRLQRGDAFMLGQQRFRVADDGLNRLTPSGRE